MIEFLFFMIISFIVTQVVLQFSGQPNLLKMLPWFDDEDAEEEAAEEAEIMAPFEAERRQFLAEAMADLDDGPDDVLFGIVNGKPVSIADAWSNYVVPGKRPTKALTESEKKYLQTASPSGKLSNNAFAWLYECPRCWDIGCQYCGQRRVLELEPGPTTPTYTVNEMLKQRQISRAEFDQASTTNPQLESHDKEEQEQQP
jgi:hypothetical protein